MKKEIKMTEIYFEYYFKKKPKQFDPKLPFLGNLKKEILKTQKFYLEFLDYKWRNNVNIKGGFTQVTDGVIIPKKYSNTPTKYKNITYGIFNVIQINGRDIKIVNDLFGGIPSYYYHDDDFFIYSTKIKPIISRLKDLNKSITKDKDAINLSKEIGYFIEDYTYVKEIKRVLAATEIIIKNNKLTQKRYHLPVIVKEKYSDKELFKRLNKDFSMIFSEVNKDIGLFLSGGLDSRLILGHMLRNNVDATSITFGFDTSSEITIAKKIAQITNIKLVKKEFTVNEIIPCIKIDAVLREGFGVNRSSFVHLFKETIINNKIHYLFNGFLGDAVLGGSYLTRKTSSIKELIKELLAGFHVSIPENEIVLKASKFIINRTFKYKNKANYNRNNQIVLSALRKLKEECNIKLYEDLVNLYLIYYAGFRGVLYGVLSTRQYAEIMIPFMTYPFFLDLLKMPQHQFKYHKIYKKYMIQEFPKLAAIKNKNWNVNCYKPTFYQRLSEYREGFMEGLLKPKINSLFNKNIFRKDSYVDYAYWFRESKEFRKFMGTKKFMGFEEKRLEVIEKILENKL